MHFTVLNKNESEKHGNENSWINNYISPQSSQASTLWSRKLHKTWLRRWQFYFRVKLQDAARVERLFGEPAHWARYSLSCNRQNKFSCEMYLISHFQFLTFSFFSGLHFSESSSLLFTYSMARFQNPLLTIADYMYFQTLSEMHIHWISFLNNFRLRRLLAHVSHLISVTNHIFHLC